MFESCDLVSASAVWSTIAGRRNELDAIAENFDEAVRVLSLIQNKNFAETLTARDSPAPHKPKLIATVRLPRLGDNDRFLEWFMAGAGLARWTPALASLDKTQKMKLDVAEYERLLQNWTNIARQNTLLLSE